MPSSLTRRKTQTPISIFYEDQNREHKGVPSCGWVLQPMHSQTGGRPLQHLGYGGQDELGLGEVKGC